MEILKLIDTHCHLNFKAFKDDFLEVAEKSYNEGINKIIIPGSDIHTSQGGIKITREINQNLGKKFAFAAVGIHPIHFKDAENFDEIEKLAESPEVVAIGESGIDLFHQKSKDELAAQKELFVRHIDLAFKTNKPLIVHNRQADKEVIEILNSFERLPKMEFHCFSSDWEYAQKVLKLGAYISFTGNITYGNPTSLKLRGAGINLKVVERAPLHKIMIQTDSPYLVPEPLRSQGIARNEPRYVLEVARKIAEIRGESLEDICTQTTANAKKFLGM